MNRLEQLSSLLPRKYAEPPASAPLKKRNSTVVNRVQVHLILALYSALCAAPTATRWHPTLPPPTPTALAQSAPGRHGAEPTLRCTIAQLSIARPHCSPQTHRITAKPHTGVTCRAEQQIRFTGGNRAYMAPITGLRA